MWYNMLFNFDDMIKIVEVNVDTLLISLFLTPFLIYRKAGQLPVKSPLPNHLFEIVVGMVLGDLHIYRHKTENASLHIEQSIKNEKYLLHLFELFKNYCKVTKPTV